MLSADPEVKGWGFLLFGGLSGEPGLEQVSLGSGGASPDEDREDADEDSFLYCISVDTSVPRSQRQGATGKGPCERSGWFFLPEMEIYFCTPVTL